MEAMASDEPYAEVLLRATASELAVLRRRLNEPSGLLAMDARGAASPCEQMLLQLLWNRASGLITISADTESLVIAGGPDAFELLRADTETWSASGPGDHFHVEPYPDHPWLDQGSASLVIEVL